jgi:asparagine synthase (glutamine-hydrolysing)
VSRVAAEKVKVVLSGEGGDELFLGYPRMKLLAGLKRNSELHPLFDALFLASPSFRGKQRVFSSIADRLASAQERYLLSTSPARDWSPHSGWIAAQRIMSTSDPLWIDRDLYLENMLMRKTDMATMYSSIEGRVPLLGVELWNAAPQFSAENLRMNGKALLKEMLAQYIPEALIDRPKSGFGIPIREIFLSSPRLRQDLANAHGALHGLGIAYPDIRLLQERYPVYGFGLVALYRSLKNLSLI